MPLQISVDTEVCDLHKQCIYAAPAVFRLDALGDLAWDSEVSDDLADVVEDAQFLCPSQAISVTSP